MRTHQLQPQRQKKTPRYPRETQPMDIAGLVIAVFNEVLDICVFINQTINDAANHDKDFAKLEFEFSYQKAILDTFGKRFIHGKVIYQLEDSWVVKMRWILEELKKVVREYRRLSTKYNKNRQIAGAPWWKSGKANREDLRLEAAGEASLTTSSSPKKSLGFGFRFSRKLTQLEWALFDRAKLEDIVNEQKSWTEKLVEIMKLTLLLYSSNDVLQVEELSKDAQTLGFSSLTNKRLLILDSTRGDQPEAMVLDASTISLSSAQPAKPQSMKSVQAQLSNAILGGSEVLIEYKNYPKDNDQVDLNVTKERIKFLSKLLTVKADDTHGSSTFSLHCLGYFHEPDKSRFGLAFGVPRGHEGVPLSLNSAISTLTGNSRPTLGQRFGIAYRIGYTLIEWFLVDWVHKSISSHNIHFFRETGHGQEEWDFSSAYLGGFEYARPAHGQSNEAFNHADFLTNVYRHPARQGLPSEGFKKTHDIYAFGVLLLEIGLWTVASSRELFKDQSQKTNAIRETLIKNARGRLGHFMGQKYCDAVLFCLEGASGVGQDDEKQTKLITAFKERVLDVCEEGQRLL